MLTQNQRRTYIHVAYSINDAMLRLGCDAAVPQNIDERVVYEHLRAAYTIVATLLATDGADRGEGPFSADRT